MEEKKVKEQDEKRNQKYSLFPVNSLSAAKLFEIARLVWFRLYVVSAANCILKISMYVSKCETVLFFLYVRILLLLCHLMGLPKGCISTMLFCAGILLLPVSAATSEQRAAI